MSLEQIKSMEKESFAKLVKEKWRETIFKDLMAMKSTHSKMENLKYDKFEMSQYLKVSDKWSASSAYKFRTRMSEVGENFHGKYGNNPICPSEGCNISNTVTWNALLGSKNQIWHTP